MFLYTNYIALVIIYLFCGILDTGKHVTGVLKKSPVFHETKFFVLSLIVFKIIILSVKKKLKSSHWLNISQLWCE